VHAWRALCRAWSKQLPKPLLLGVQGYCIYHATALVAVADICLAASDLRYMPSLIECVSPLPTAWPLDRRRGSRPARPTPWLGRGCTGALANIRATHRYNSLPFETGLSLKRAKEILFLQRFVLAEEARELGIINRVVSPPEELDRELLELARQIASADPFHLQMMKRMANSAAEAAGLETVARQNLYTWATYRWDWSARGHAAGDGAPGVSILDAVHFD
jgi:enoyl-CoA hydratase/carnithine racemase